MGRLLASRRAVKNLKVGLDGGNSALVIGF